MSFRKFNFSLKKLCLNIFMLFLIISPFNASSNENDQSYEQAFLELSTQPITQLDLKIIQLNLALNDEKNHVYLVRIPAHAQIGENTIVEVDGEPILLEYSRKLPVSYSKCYRDPANDKTIICEANLGGLLENDIKQRIQLSKQIYNGVLEQAKLTIHKSFNPAYLKVIIKRQLFYEARLEELNLISQHDYFLSHPIQEEVWVIWENGIPYYQDAIFND